ncbi:transposase [Vibrio neptunius]|uniref:Transposase n=1 Tax=Vibrio neptunius TaxID=170651 RepID=A0ABS3A8U9_9VIBR|nr:transposase [Vibrio neptunius]MBN3495824.1 transposase [Vibrio neptunius]MBN3518237.1 transposase [Vibrio neptunius]MBN3552576.1 transposase [Vibrio neptunius]MBN3580505.1 transposase [Vibrio neptunius]MCH9874172.1 transposase [Vibrio neptunius]
MNKRFTDEFKIQAVKQVTAEGYSVASVAERLDVSTNSIYYWIKQFGDNSQQFAAESEQNARIRELEKQLKRATQERDILKEAVFFMDESKKNTRL